MFNIDTDGYIQKYLSIRVYNTDEYTRVYVCCQLRRPSSNDTPMATSIQILVSNTIRQ